MREQEEGLLARRERAAARVPTRLRVAQEPDLARDARGALAQLRGDVVGHRGRARLGDTRLHPGERAQGPSIFKEDYSFIKYDVEKGEENCRPAAW